ncbi:hypothetical protein AVEN_2023-1 [Araneus ventricosus]|uniref:Uncharacterized protein n=1 Tax=Araneus ventricosus TaxID=182803 RepID=A0A4Y2V678_ARAVE|nr:hypothetical protein AVEN_2023-1 [Araneus ventricosus]
MDLNNECKLKGLCASILTYLHHQLFLKAEPKTLTTSQSHLTVTKFSAVEHWTDLVFPTEQALPSYQLLDVGIISESNVSNIVDRNKIQRGRTKARTTLLSQVIKDYDQLGLYFDGRKDRTL